MATRQLYQIERDHTTRDGGYAATMRRVERQQPTSEEIYRMRVSHFETPRTERNEWFYGVDDALWDALQGAIAREEKQGVPA